MQLWHYDVTNLRHVWGWSYPEIANGEYWRLITSGFLHSDEVSPVGPLGLAHLGANLFVLAIVAPRFERRCGTGSLLACFVVLHVAAFLVWIPMDRVYFGVGASGALAAFTGVLLTEAAGKSGRDWPCLPPRVHARVVGAAA